MNTQSQPVAVMPHAKPPQVLKESWVIEQTGLCVMQQQVQLMIRLIAQRQ